MLKRFNIVRFSLTLLLLTATSTGYAEDTEAAYAARTKAADANAETLAPGSWQAAEKDLDKALQWETAGKSSGKVAGAFRDAIEEFNAAELEAIDIDLLQETRQALRAADDQRAKRYAPLTRSLAQDQLKAAEAAFAADPYDRKTISALANSAAANARYATRIANVVRANPEIETLLRERDAYIDRIGAAAGVSSAVDADPEKVVAELEIGIGNLSEQRDRLQSDLQDSQAFVAALEEEIRQLDEQLGGASNERRALVLQIEQQARNEEKFLQTENMFAEGEAEVLRQSDAIVVRLIGLEFAPGASKLDASNLPLLTQVNEAIRLYPNAMLVVEGHTDSQGSSRMNQRLSQNRAEAVRDYIVMNMQILPARITAMGYGPDRPIANNDTKEGRSKNRRIDLVIKPASDGTDSGGALLPLDQ